MSTVCVWSRWSYDPKHLKTFLQESHIYVPKKTKNVLQESGASVYNLWLILSKLLRWKWEMWPNGPKIGMVDDFDFAESTRAVTVIYTASGRGVAGAQREPCGADREI